MHYDRAGTWLKPIEGVHAITLMVSIFVPSELGTCRRCEPCGVYRSCASEDEEPFDDIRLDCASFYVRLPDRLLCQPRESRLPRSLVADTEPSVRSQLRSDHPFGYAVGQ
jgi:hypothetical protein